ncbi:MAG: hypothetical protein ACM3OO_01175 [Planctomycetaceae bacterium]
MDPNERARWPAAVPFGDADPRDVVYAASVSCARCGEVNRLVPVATMFLCQWCLAGETSPSASRARVSPLSSRRRRVSMRRSSKRRAA